MARFARAGGKAGFTPGQSTPLYAYPSRDAMNVAEQGYERAEIPGYVEILPAPVPSWEQGRGKTPGFQWPWRRVFQSLVPKGERMGAHWPNQRLTPPRPEQHGWGAAYNLYYEQQSRHAWPGGGVGAPQVVIDHPETLPLAAFARRL